MKSSLKRLRFYDPTGITKNATEELKRLSQNGFQECFQCLYSRWQKCVFAQGHFFRRKYGLNSRTVLYFSEMK
jgi:hypothetical protein